MTNAADSFKSALAARLTRPLLLAPGSYDLVRSSGAFRPRADGPPGSSSSGSRPYRLVDGVAVVEIKGALAQRAWECFCYAGDGYDAIAERVRAALADHGTRAVMLCIDSPGGEVAGCFEAVRAIRAAAKETGKPVVAYADECALSAGYALACACDRIVVPDTGMVGSAGVIACFEDQSGANELLGLKVNLITSGARKADGHPGIPMSDEARLALQAEVDQLAVVFFSEVAFARPLTDEQVRSLEAATLIGQAAVSAGLADLVGGYEAALHLARDLGAQSQPRAPRAGARRMRTIMEALGLSAEGTEAEAVIALSRLKTEHTRLVSATGSTEAAEAEGLIRLWQASHARVGELETAESERKAKAETAEREMLIKKAFEAGRLRAEDRDDPDGFVRTMPLAGLRKFAEGAKRIVPVGVAHEEPTPSVPQRDWSSLSARERHELLVSNPELAERMRSPAR